MGSALLGATLIGALVMPAAALAVGFSVADDAILMAEDGPAATGNVLTNDTLAVRVTGVHAPSAGVGILAIAENGDYTFTPAANYSGGPVVTWYYADDDATAGGDLLAYVRITVTPANDAPVATAQAVTTDEDTDKAITLAGTDVEGSALTYAIVGQPAHGTLSGSGASRTYTPDADWNGQDAFTFKVNDGEADSAPATVAIEVVGVEDLPVASDQSVDVVYNTAKAITLTAIDGDDDTLTWDVSAPAHGVLSGTAPNLTFTPVAGYVGADSFTFAVNDGDDDSNTATVSITVAADVADPMVAAPVVAFGTGRVNESAPLKITWSATDAGTGVKTYTVEAKVGSGAWTEIYTGTGTNATRFYPFSQDLYWRVKAEDNAGNVSDWSTSAKRRLAAYQGGSPVAYTGTWRSVASSGSSGTGYRYTTTLGKKVTLSFTGMGVLYVAPKTSSAGYVKVTIAGVTSRINLRASSTSLGVIVKSKMWPTVGSHAIRVLNDSSGRRATFDAFVVLK
jgi:hypothetical protein